MGKLGRMMRDAAVRAARGEFVFEGSHVDPLAVVMIVDATRDQFQAVIAAANDAAAECARQSSVVPVVIGVAVHEIEAWLLADEASRVAAFGDEIGKCPLPESPEEIRDPKSLWRSLHGKVSSDEDEDGRDYWLRRRMAWLALRREIVRARCPRFAEFESAYTSRVVKVL